MLQPKIEKRKIIDTANVLIALQKFDESNTKLLLVFNKVDVFVGLLSIGDVQRAIIKNVSFYYEIKGIMRKDITIAKQHDSIEEIKKLMFVNKIECMPIVNESNEIVDLIELALNEPKNKSAIKTISLPVVIMAGGYGNRLKPLTYVFPKPLIPVGEKTIIEEIINNFKNFGSKEFYITLNYKSNIIKYYLDENCDNEVKLNYVDEKDPLGTAGSLYLLREKLKTTFFVSNCDILIKDDYNEILDYHNHSKNDITLVASLKQYNIPYGTIKSGENGELIELKEKPNLAFLINTGMYILEPQVLDKIKDQEFLHITDLIDRIKNEGGKVGVFPISEKSWVDMGDWNEYDKILNEYR